MHYLTALLEILLKFESREFPGGPEVRTLSFHYRGPGFDSWLGSWDPARNDKGEKRHYVITEVRNEGRVLYLGARESLMKKKWLILRNVAERLKIKRRDHWVGDYMSKFYDPWRVITLIFGTTRSILNNWSHVVRPKQTNKQNTQYFSLSILKNKCESKNRQETVPGWGNN